MAKKPLFGLTGRDVQRLQRVVRTVEDNPAMRNLTRIHGQSGGGGGITRLYATVIRGLLPVDGAREEEDGPVEGYGAYILRLDESTYAAWSAGTYPVNTLRTHGGLLYKVIAAVETSLEPGVSEGWESDWQLQTEINPRHLEFGEVTDWRWFVPWHGVGATVELISKGGQYYFSGQMIRTKSSSDGMQTICWNDDDLRAMAVFG